MNAEMLVHDTVIAIAADAKSCKSFHLIKIREEEKEKTEDMEDGFGHITKKRMKHLEGLFLERKFDFDNLYTISKRPNSTFFFKESVMFPSVQLESKKGYFEITHEELLMIIKYMELSNQTSLFWQT